MTKRAFLAIVTVCVLALLGAWMVLAFPGATFDPATAATVDGLPAIRPDYSGTVIPPNIAPLNFLIEEAGTDYVVRVHGAQGEAIELRTRDPRIAIPPGAWRKLLEANRGQEISFDVSVRDSAGAWKRFQPIVNSIADSEIDNYLFYRLIQPAHTVFRDLSICQRDVRTYAETIVAENGSFGNACVNCHTFSPHHPDRMVLQTRGGGDGNNYSGTFVVHDGQVEKVNTASLAKGSEADRGRIGKAMAGYSAWHPNGESIAYSANDIFQFFHAVGEVRDVFDRASDLALLHVDSNRVSTSPEISKPDRSETFPTWSPDGRTLYFCAADTLPQEQYKEVRYDLMRIGYDPESGDWGELETVLSSEETGMTILEPRVSPDGKWLLFCMSDYGAFPVFQSSCDLYLLDLGTGQHHKLPVNSGQSDSWHCWSSNSRWIAFASKRRDGVFGRVYFSYVDETGHAHKPFVLPQKDPTFYDRFIKNYNVPELVPFPAPVTSRVLGRVIRNSGEESKGGGGMMMRPKHP